jgi:hypothetical protein
MLRLSSSFALASRHEQQRSEAHRGLMTLRGVCPQDGDSVEQGTPLATKRLAGQQHETYSALSRAGVADTPASLGMKGSARSLENGHLSSRIFD